MSDGPQVSPRRPPLALLGAAAAVLMLLTLLAVLVPHAIFKYARRRREAGA